MIKILAIFAVLIDVVHRLTNNETTRTFTDSKGNEQTENVLFHEHFDLGKTGYNFNCDLSTTSSPLSGTVHDDGHNLFMHLIFLVTSAEAGQVKDVVSYRINDTTYANIMLVVSRTG